MKTRYKVLIGLGVVGGIGVLLASTADAAEPPKGKFDPAKPGKPKLDVGKAKPDDEKPTLDTLFPTADAQAILAPYIRSDLRSGTGGIYMIKAGDDEPNVARLALKHDKRTESNVGYGHAMINDYIQEMSRVRYNRDNYGTVWTEQQTHGRPKYNTAEIGGTRYTTHWAYLPRHANNLMRLGDAKPPKRTIDAMGRAPTTGTYGAIWLPDAYVDSAGNLVIIDTEPPVAVRKLMGY